MVDVLERRAFVGRERELARLLGLFADVTGGSGRIAVVAGEAGIGKSRLVAEFANAIGGRARVEVGACLPLGSGSLPYSPFVEILRDVVRTVEPAALPALLGPGRDVLIRLVPDAAARQADLAETAQPEATAQLRLFELVLRVFERLARERPLVLVVEDIQWADRSTRELLTYLARGLRDDPVLLVITLRTDDEHLAPSTLDLIAELERDDGVERIDLEPFGRPEVADQVRALLDDRPEPDVIDHLYERSDGNPFFVEELVLAGARDGDSLPAVIRDVIASRLAALGPSTLEILRAATVGGPEIDEELLGDALGIRPAAVATALREAIAAGVLERPGAAAAPRFRHALLRESVDAELFPTERAALHRAYAEALVRRVANGSTTVTAADLARHWDGAHEPALALRSMVEAARAAAEVYAWPEALEHWQRARALFGAVPDGESTAGLRLAELDGEAADCAVLAGDYRTAIELGRAAIDAVDAAADPALAGTLHNRLRWYLFESGDRHGAAQAIEAALRLIPSEPPSPMRAQALAQHAGILMFAGRYEESIAEAREAIDLAKRVGAPGELALATGVLGWDLAARGDVDAGIDAFRRGQRIANELGWPEGIALAAINLVTLLDRVGRSREELAAARESSERVGSIGLARTYGALLLGYAAKAELALGQWDAAERTTSTALRAGATDRPELWLSINRARLLVGRGRFDEAHALLERARALERRLGGTEFRGALILAEADLAVWRHDLEAARRAGAAGIELARSGARPDTSLAWLAILAVRAEADALDRERSRAGGTSDARATAIARLDAVEATVRATLAERPELATGARTAAIQQLLVAERSRLDAPPRPELWAAAASAWASLGRPYDAAYARFRQAAAVIESRGDREDAARVLAEARETATALGAAPLGAEIEALARAARLSLAGGGARGADQPAEDPYGFTPRERDVLELVAAGRTNQQIADTLFITRKTASVHVSNLMAKLGAANRSEAAALAHRLGLVGPRL